MGEVGLESCVTGRCLADFQIEFRSRRRLAMAYRIEIRYRRDFELIIIILVASSQQLKYLLYLLSNFHY